MSSDIANSNTIMFSALVHEFFVSCVTAGGLFSILILSCPFFFLFLIINVDWVVKKLDRPYLSLPHLSVI